MGFGVIEVGEDGVDAAVVVVAAGYCELGEDVLNVAGDGPG